MAICLDIKNSIGKQSIIRKMFEEGSRLKEIHGPDNVFDFSLGNPAMDPPPRFKEVIAREAASSDQGRHAYMPNAGYLETRQAVAEHLSRHNLTRLGAEDVLMTVGAAGALNVVLKTLLNPGDEVIIPTPYFVEYDHYLHNHGGRPRLVPTRDDFALDLDAITQALNPSTKAVLINSPNNPTGRVYSRQELEGLARILDRWQSTVYLISDEPYRRIVYGNIEVPSVLDAYRHSIVVTSFSKDLSLPGERIGYAALNPQAEEAELIREGMALCNRILGFVNAPAFMQRVISHLMEEKVDIAAYERKKDMLCTGLAAFGYRFHPPQGAFYLFLQAPGGDDLALVEDLQEENILTVPGTAFGKAGYIRIAYCVADSVIKKALPGFGRVMARRKNHI